MRLTLLALLGLPLIASACRGDGSSSTDGGGSNQIDTPIGGSVHVQDIQNDAMPPGTAVELHGVIVTAIDAYGSKTGDMWVEEPAGGMFSGIHVFGAPLSVVATLAPGDVVDITGAVKEEFALTTDTSGNTETELGAPSGGMMVVTKTGHGDVPAPAVVDALAIGQMADFHARDAEWEKWEGVLITVNNVSSSNTPACVGTACTDPTLQSFSVTGDLEVESSLAMFPDGLVRGECFTSVVGVESYFFNNLLYPRSTADIGTGGTACPVENTHALCSDGIDNDGNGFMDCMDFSCQLADPACTTTATVVGVQMGTNIGTVQLSNVYVTAVAQKAIWVADSLTADQYDGVQVFINAAPPAGAVIGATVNVQGNVTEFNHTAGGDSLTELTNPVIAVIAPPGTLPTPATTATAQTLADISAVGEPWEGVLVQLAHVKVTSLGMHNQVTLTDLAGHTVTMDDDVLFAYGNTAAPQPPVGTCYATLTGVMNVQTDDDVRTIDPRQTGDMVTGTGCAP